VVWIAPGATASGVQVAPPSEEAITESAPPDSDPAIRNVDPQAWWPSIDVHSAPLLGGAPSACQVPPASWETDMPELPAA
jgi:hypothetical protein